MIKRHLTLCLALSALGTGTILAQEPPVPPPLAAAPAPNASPVPPAPSMTVVPPTPPTPPVPPRRAEHRQHRADEQTTFLGIGVEPIPDWLGEQLNLPTGFGLVVNYVTPGSPAEVAGVKPHDILKQINDQLIANPEQLVTLVESYKDGQEVTLTMLHKGQETKLNAKLTQKKGEDEPRRRPKRDRFSDEGGGLGGIGYDLQSDILKELGPQIREATREAGEAAREASREAGEAAREAGRRAAEKVRREIMILRDKDGQVSKSKINLDKGRVVIRNDRGEVEITSGKDGSMTVIKDPMGKEIYSGPTKDAPPGTLDQMAVIGENGKISVKGKTVVLDGKKEASDKNNKEDGDDDDGDDEAPVPPPAGR